MLVRQWPLQPGRGGSLAAGQIKEPIGFDVFMEKG